MSQDKQTLSPTEWKSVTDYVIELSQCMTQAVSSPPSFQQDKRQR
jgi:hypothetical protein